MTLYCRLNRDERCPERSPFSFSSWNPGNSFSFSGPCRNTMSFQSSYFLTITPCNFWHVFAILRCSRIRHIINYNNISSLISQGSHSILRRWREEIFFRYLDCGILQMYFLAREGSYSKSGYPGGVARRNPNSLPRSSCVNL